MAKKEAAHTVKPGSFESSMKRLEEIIERIESGETSLDKVVEMYEEGVKLSRECLDYLDKTELRLKKLSKDIEGKFSLADENLGE